MGYSCAVKASYTLDAIGELIGGSSSNGMPDGGFWEQGREQKDGAITGTVWKLIRRYSPEERAARAAECNAKPEWIGDPCMKRGSFRIEPTGKVTRFPGLTADLLRKAESMGAEKYSDAYEEPTTFNKARARLLAMLGYNSISVIWRYVELCAKLYQKEHKIMFLGLPGTSDTEIKAWLNALA